VGGVLLHNPLNLLLLLTTIPVILLYLLRLKRRDVRVPSTLLWDRMIRDLQANAPLQKLRVNLLLILQLLILVLASLAFAAPFVKSRTLSGENQVVILDASLSMQSRDVSPSRFAAAQAEALKMVDGLRRRDQMMVIEAGARTRVMCGFTSEKATLRRAVETCAPRDVSSNLREAIVLTLSMSRNTSVGTRIYVFSDGAFDAIPDVQLPSNTQASFVQFGKAGRNVAVTGLDIRRSLRDPSRCDLFVAVDNFGDKAVQCPLTVELDGSLLRARKAGEFTIAARDRGEALFSDLAGLSGLLTARADVEDDLPTDNVAHAVVAGRRSLRVLLAAPGRSPFLEKALNADPFVKLFAAKSAEFRPGDSAEYDAVVFDGDSPDEVGPGSYLLFGTAPKDSPVTVTGTEERPKVTDWNPTHPITRLLPGLGGVRMAEGKTATVADWGKVLAETAQTPLIVVGERRGYRFVYVGFDVAKSDIIVRPAFPLLIIGALEWLTSDPTQLGERYYRAGEAVSIPVSPGTEHLVVHTPKDQDVDVPVRSNPVLFDGTEYAGIYEVKAGAESTRFIVNILDRRESNTKPKSEIRLAGTGEPTKASTVQSNLELWRYIIMVALGVLTLEWWIYHRRV